MLTLLYLLWKVFDYDWGFQDDFMGMCTLDASRLPLHKSQELSLTLTENNLAGETPMGEIILTVTLVPKTTEEKDVVSPGLSPTFTSSTPTPYNLQTLFT